jgi:3-deoxy-manno-octulosonate cytidylyltransferase (CMP-KDO synthetase)
MNVIGIIPARYASTRFPGKPLVDIGGKLMIQRVYEQVSKILADVYVATDDERIKKAVEAFGGKVAMTSTEHRSGTDRCAEALDIAQKAAGKLFDVVINIQGDEPFIQPYQIQLLMDCFTNEATDIATLVKPFAPGEDVTNPNQVKAILNLKGEAIYFSRSPIPYLRNVPTITWSEHFVYLKHLGIYAYRASVLKSVTQMDQTSLELAESLEQNRWIENGLTIRVEKTDFESLAVDTPEDLEKIKEYLVQNKL